MIKLDFSYALGAQAKIGKNSRLAQKLQDSYKCLMQKSGPGSSFLGWTEIGNLQDPKLIQEIKNKAQELRSKSQVFVCVGIGGSYLGARAVIEALRPEFSDGICAEAAGAAGAGAAVGTADAAAGAATSTADTATAVENCAASVQPTNTTTTNRLEKIVYAGHNLSEDYMYRLLKYLDHKDYSVCVISKSGTTTEPAIAFRLLRKHLQEKYGKEEAASRIVAITDKERGALRGWANEEGCTSFVVPDNIGGRYSVLSPVGLFPIAMAGIDIEALLKGAACAENEIKSADCNLSENIAMKYAFFRQFFHQKGYSLEVLANYESNLNMLSQWWVQLFGESEGKMGKGLYPATASFTTDLHSMGQYIQQGNKILIETVLSVENSMRSVMIEREEVDSDGMNFVAGKRISAVNAVAEQATCMAHSQIGNVPVLRIVIDSICEKSIGELIYFFEVACAVSAYSLDVNPFDQPGVEAYKLNMFSLLGKI